MSGLAKFLPPIPTLHIQNCFNKKKLNILEILESNFACPNVSFVKICLGPNFNNNYNWNNCKKDQGIVIST